MHVYTLSGKHVLAFIAVCFVFYSTLTKAQYWTSTQTMNPQHMLHKLCFSIVISLLKNVPNTRWTNFERNSNEISLLRSAPSSNHLCSACPDTWFMLFFKARPNGNAHSPNSWHFQASFLASLSLTWNALPTNSRPPLPSCKVDSHDIQIQPFPTLCYWHFLTKGHGKGTRALQKIMQSL